MEYDRSIVTFLDLLGFRELVDKRSPEVLLSLLNRLRDETKPSPFAEKAMGVSALTFSDCTVRVAPILSGNDNPFVRASFSLGVALLLFAENYLTSQPSF